MMFCITMFMGNSQPPKRTNRRTFLKTSALCGMSSIFVNWPTVARGDEVPGELRFGVIADVHKDIMHDADQRLRTFVDTMKKEDVNFIVQLGDFCIVR